MMDYQRLHPWKVNIQEASEIQRDLRKRIILSSDFSSIKRIAGVDVGFSSDKAKACVVILSFPGLALLEVRTTILRIDFPYVSGLLTFREGPAILKTFKKIRTRADVILFDGQGICHPRRMGLATHLGILLGIPSIGCAKSLLCGNYDPPARTRRAYSKIYDRVTGETLGAALRTRTAVKPLFVSVGYRIDLGRSIELVLATSPKFRIPEPLRCAHRLAKL